MKVTRHFRSDDLRGLRFSNSRRPDQQGVIERFVVRKSCFQSDFNLSDDRTLPDQGKRPANRRS